MKIWKMKDKYLGHFPNDAVCIEMGDLLLYIQEEGTYDVASITEGTPTLEMWEVIADDT